MNGFENNIVLEYLNFNAVIFLYSSIAVYTANQLLLAFEKKNARLAIAYNSRSRLFIVSRCNINKVVDEAKSRKFVVVNQFIFCEIKSLRIEYCIVY